MNVYVFILFACLIHVCILPKTLANSLPNRDDFEVDIDDDLPEESDEFDMSYLKCTSGGCKLVKGAVKELPKPGPWVVDGEEPHTRTKRRMFFPDNRLRIRAKSAGRYPFNSAVAIRVNGEVKCSGVALFPRFFLTAAHCVQPDGQWKGGFLFGVERHVIVMGGWGVLKIMRGEKWEMSVVMFKDEGGMFLGLFHLRARNSIPVVSSCNESTSSLTLPNAARVFPGYLGFLLW